MIGWDADGEAVIAPHASSRGSWSCDCCGVHAVGTLSTLPTAWRKWRAPELGVLEDVLCSDCWDARALAVDLDVTGEDPGQAVA